MDRPMSCEYFMEHLNAYLDSELDRQDRQRMDAHAANCPECGEKLESMTRLLTMCAELDEGLTVPLPAQAAWRKAIREEEKAHRKGSALRRWVSGVAAALVLLVGGTFAYRMNDALVAPKALRGSTVSSKAFAGGVDRYANSASYGDYDGGSAGRVMLASDGAVYEEEALEVEADAADDVQAASETRSQVVLRTAERRLESTNFPQSLQGIQDLVSEYQGYFEQSVVDGQPFTEGGRGRTAQMNARVPSQDLDAFLTALDAAGTVTYRSESAEDVSDRYYDVDARLSGYRAQLARLNEMMSSAQDLEDMLLLEDKRTEVLQDIDSLEGQLKGWDSRARRSSVYITLNEVEERGQVKPVDEVSLWERVKAAFFDSVNWLCEFLQDSAVVLAAAAPTLVIVIPLIVVICLIVAAIRRRHRRKKA